MSETVDTALSRVSKSADRWFCMDPAAKLGVLDGIVANMKNGGAEALDTETAIIRGYEPGRPELIDIHTQSIVGSSIVIASWLSEISEMYRQLSTKGILEPLPTGNPLPDGGMAVKVGPFDLMNSLLQFPCSVEIHVPKDQLSSIQTDKTRKIRQVPNPISVTLKNPGVVAILGAGNYNAPIDILHAVFLDNKVCVYKPNPLMGPGVEGALKYIFSPLVDIGVLAFVSGGVAEGAKLVDDPRVCSWYVTGSLKTFRAILGSESKNPSTSLTRGAKGTSIVDPTSGDATRRNTKPKAAEKDSTAQTVLRKELQGKEIIAELGGNAPVIVSPEWWPSWLLRLHARHLAYYASFNGGHICVRPQTIITSRNWKQRDQFLHEVKLAIEELPAWKSFYPGTTSRMEDFAGWLVQEGHPEKTFRVVEKDSEKVFGPTRAAQRFIFCTGVSDTSRTLKEEAFAPVLIEVPLEPSSDSPGEFLVQAAEFARTEIFGKLAANIIGPFWKSATRKGLARAICILPHGAIGVNVNAIGIISTPAGMWGAGRPAGVDAHLGDVDSGVGTFGNWTGVVGGSKTVMRSGLLSMSLISQRASNTKPYLFGLVPRIRAFAAISRAVFRVGVSSQFTRGRLSWFVKKVFYLCYALFLLFCRCALS